MSSNNEDFPQKNRKFTSLGQLDLLVKYMEQHIHVSMGRGKSKEDRAEAGHFWQECSGALNVGGVCRSPKEWCRYWNDLKNRVKVKLRHNNKVRLSDDGTMMEFSPIEKRIAKLIRKALPKKFPTYHDDPSHERDPEPIQADIKMPDMLEASFSATESDDPLTRKQSRDDFLNDTSNSDEKPLRPKKSKSKTRISSSFLNESLLNSDADEFQYFGCNIAAQLRELPLDRALRLQMEIQNLVAKERIQFFQDLKKESEIFFISENDIDED